MAEIDRTIEKLKRETQSKAEKQSQNTVSELESIVRASNVQLSKRSEKINEAVKQIIQMQANQSAKDIRGSMQSIKELESEIGNVKSKKEQDVLRQVIDKSKQETARKGSLTKSAMQAVGGTVKKRIPKPSSLAIGAAGLTGSTAMVGLTSYLANRGQNIRMAKQNKKQEELQKKRDRLQMLEEIKQSEGESGGEAEQKQTQQIQEQTSIQSRQLDQTSELNPILTRIRDILEMQLTEEQRNNLRQIENRRESRRRANLMARDAKGRFIGKQQDAAAEAAGDDGISAGEVSLGILGGKGVMGLLKKSVIPLVGLGRFLLKLPGVKQLGSLVSKGKTLLPKVGGLLKGLGNVFKWLAPLKGAVDGIVELIETGSIKSAISEFLSSTIEFGLMGLVDSKELRKPFDKFVEGFSNIFSNPREAIQKILGGTGDVIMKVATSVTDFLIGKAGDPADRGVLGAISDWFGGLDFTSLKGVGESMMKIVDKLLIWLGKLSAGVLDYFGFDKLGDRVAQWFGEDSSPLKKLWQSIKDAFFLVSDFFTVVIPTYVNRAFDNVIKWVKSIPDKIISMLPSSVRNFLGLSAGEGTKMEEGIKNDRDREMKVLQDAVDRYMRIKSGAIQDSGISQDEAARRLKETKEELRRLKGQTMERPELDVGAKRSITGDTPDSLAGTPLSQMRGLTTPSTRRDGELLGKVGENRAAKEAGSGANYIFQNHAPTQNNNNNISSGDSGASALSLLGTKNPESTMQKIVEKDMDNSL